mmetsp:Transcript_11827/g.37583  ORF Transcript_11827/g.37583 Transcript_11827/m.37583 type:complete len:415 (-) Transcript_11827:246-1490(-)
MAIVAGEPAAVIRIGRLLLLVLVLVLVLLIADVVLRVAVVVPVHAVRAVLVRRPRAVVVVLALGEVLGAEVPVHVDSAQVGVVVVVEDGRAPVAGVEATDVAARDVGACLLEHLHERVLHALDVVEVVVARRRVIRLLPFARVDGRVHLHLLERVLRGGDADGESGGDNEADKEAHRHLDETDDRFFFVELLRALLERCEAEDDGKDEERAGVAEVADGEGPVVDEVVREADFGDEVIVARPLRLVHADREAHDDEEARGEGEPDEAGEALGELCGEREQADESQSVENDHHGGGNLGDDGEGHGREARLLELGALEEVHRVLEAVGRDDARHGGNDLEEAELVDVLLQGLAGARLAPAVARRVVVQADAVLRAKKLVGAVVEAVMLEVDRFAVQGRRECGEAGQVGGVLELDD